MPAGSRFRLEPVAMMACLKSTPLTSPPSSASEVDEVTRACPRSTVTPRRLSACAATRPFWPCTMPEVHSRSLSVSICTLSNVSPNSAARRAVSRISTVWISALEGMHPSSRQVPPGRSRLSTSSTFLPRSARRSAAT